MSYLAVTVLLALLGLMLALPLVPALAELRNRTDAKPLSVIQEHAGEIRHFAHGFRTYITSLQGMLQQCVATRSTARGIMPDACEYMLLGRPLNPRDLPVREHDATCDLVLVAGAPLKTPPGIVFSKEIYAAADFIGGEGDTYRAILGEKNVYLGAGTRVMRWVHAVGEFNGDLGCELYGRISSDCVIRLLGPTQFVRLNAPRMELGEVLSSDPRISPGPPDFDYAQSRIVNRLLYDGDYEIGEGEVITGSVVARGRLLIRSGAHIRGSVKSHHEMILEPGVVIEGSLVSASKMRIGERCRLHGPIICEHSMTIATGSCCGTLAQPTTITSPRIEVEEGVVVFGTVWAREYGRVVSDL